MSPNFLFITNVTKFIIYTNYLRVSRFSKKMFKKVFKKFKKEKKFSKKLKTLEGLVVRGWG
jgi:hypothetical protein